MPDKNLPNATVVCPFAIVTLYEQNATSPASAHIYTGTGMFRQPAGCKRKSSFSTVPSNPWITGLRM